MKFSTLSLLLLPLTIGATTSLRTTTPKQDATCSTKHSETSCMSSSSEDGSPCVWCECSAIPSECLTLEQSQSVPPGVFDCKSPSSTVLERMSLNEQPVDDDFCDANSLSGYIGIDESQYDQDGENKHLFYWMFQKRNSDITDTTIPLVVWLTGGPGCSSSLALLTENGPCTVNEDTKTTTLNPYSWTEAAHVLWLDQPAGVGFSYGSETDSNEEMISEDAYWFLQKFLAEHAEYAQNPLFIVGESYGGHYAPSIAHRVWKYNQALPSSDAAVLNLAGVAVGNGLTAPEVQYQYYPDMAFNNSHGIKVISQDEYDTMKAVVPKCTALIHQCNAGDSAFDSFACQSAFLVCNLGLTSPYQATGLNPYDIREICKVPPLCYDFSGITTFMNSKETRASLGVTKDSHKWGSCNMGINQKFHTDWMKDFSPYITDLVNDGIPTLIYAGDVDFICNYLGNQAWTYGLNWKGGEDFRAAGTHDWKGVGLARSHGPLTFLQVYDAGHMVPSDQPEVALNMIGAFLKGEAF